MKFDVPGRREWLVSVLLLAALGVTWWASKAALTGPFLFDDFPNFENLREISGCFNGDRVAGYLASFVGSPGRPLAALSFLVDDYAWPSTAYSWKRHNLLLHLLCGVLVFGFVRTLAQARHNRVTADWVALGVAAAWLLHPMQLSTSMLTVQRMTQLMTLVSLAACWWTSHRLATRPLNLGESFYLLTVGAMATVTAFLCKENGALLPLYLAVTSAWMLSTRHPRPTKVVIRTYFVALSLPVLAIAAALAYAALTQQSNGIRTFGPWERLLTESRVLWGYLQQILLPRLDGSGIFHDDIIVSRGLLSPSSTTLALFSTLGISALAIAKRKHWPLLAFAVAWFFGGHLMESTTWPLELYFEHRNYLPMVGVLSAIGIGAASIKSLKLKRATIFAVIAWLAICTTMTHLTAEIWGSTKLQAAVWANEHPNSLRAMESRAKYLVDKRDLSTARKLILSGINRDRRFNGLAIHVLLIDCYTNRLTPQGMNRAIALLNDSDFNRSTLNSLSLLRESMKNGTCRSPVLEAKWRELANTLVANPVYASNDVQSFLHVEMMQEAMARRDYDAVIRNIDAAYATSPNAVLAMTMSYMLSNGGYNEEALKWREKAESLTPPWPIPWWNWWKRIRKTSASQCPVD